MLKFLRKKTKFIVWTVIVAFISWGGYAVSLQLEDSSRAAGKIFGREISFREFQLAQRAAEIFSPSPKPDEEPLAPAEIEARSWQFIMLSREARRNGVEVTDDEVRQEILGLFPQGGGGALTGERYVLWVRGSFREEPRDFENQLREHLRIRKLVEGVREKFKENQDEELKSWLSGLYARSKLRVYETQRGR